MSAPTTASVEPLHVTGLTYGPHGIGRLDGKAIFVRGVVPGEDVEITVREDRGSFAFADVERVVHAAPERRVPPCVYLPRCGGCPWQHIAYAAQLRAKEQNLRDQLARIGGLADAPVLPIIASPREFGYRSRLTLRTAGGRVGFYAAASHELVEVEHCLLAGDAVDRAMRAAADLVEHCATNIRRVEIAQRGAQPGVVVVGEIEGPFKHADGPVIVDWLARHADVHGLVLHGKRWRRVWGDEWTTVSPEYGLTLQARAGGFTQVNPGANRLLVETVLSLGGFAPHDRVLDLYAGIGNLSIPIARRAGHVVAVERDRVAADDARRNAASSAAANCDVWPMAAHVGMRQLRRQHQSFDVVVLDPPRSGAAEIIDDLLTMQPPRIVYVSCNPSTLARDLKRLATRYRVDAVQPIDFFPHSYHSEAVVRAVLTC